VSNTIADKWLSVGGINWTPTLVLHPSYDGDGAPLCTYLRMFNEPRWTMLADLLERRLSRRKAQRVPTVAALRRELDGDPANAVQEVVVDSRREIARVRARNGGKLPYGSRRRVVDKICRQRGVTLTKDQVTGLLAGDLGRGDRHDARATRRKAGA
jgi:hypothetical protein